MADGSTIEWTDASWNPIVGCSVHSPGCKHCYAMGQAHRLASNPATPHYAGTTKMTKTGPVFTGKVALAPERVLTAPLHWRAPRRIFVNSMGDLFHENVPDEWIDRVFAVMALCPQHAFQVLTKRAERMREYMQPHARRGTNTHHRIYMQLKSMRREFSFTCPLPNLWIGVSCERQQEADERIPHLLDTPAAVRFVSAEPLLGPIDFSALDYAGNRLDALAGTCEPHTIHFDGLDWVIVGGESGPRARPMHPDWARSIRDQCAAAGVPFFFKQWGEWIEWGQAGATQWSNATRFGRGGALRTKFLGTLASNEGPLFEGRAFETKVLEPDHQQVLRVGKRRAGRLLDKREHNAFPDPQPPTVSAAVAVPSRAIGAVQCD